MFKIPHDALVFAGDGRKAEINNDLTKLPVGKIEKYILGNA